MLLTPVALLKHCADLARKDAGLTDVKRAELVGRYTTLAKQFRHEGNLALDAWVKSLAPAEDAGFRVAFQGEKLVNDWIVNRGAPSGSDSVPPQLRAAYCWVDGLMLRRLTRATTTEMSQQPTQHYVAQMLSAAPEALRDVDLALEMARRGLELTPDDEEARQSLAWALFRAGQWQACVDATPHAEALASGTIADDAEPHSILAMALWQTGRRDQALALQKHAAERLDAYERREKEKEFLGYVVMPPTSMVRRLHEEAEGLLKADNPSTPGEDGQPNSAGKGPT
jgi:tetratricopeptide (TPR) repeat protein